MQCSVIGGTVECQFVALIFIGQLTEGDYEVLRLAVANDAQIFMHARLGRANEWRQIGAVIDRLTIIGHDDIARFQATFRGRAVLLYFCHQRAVRLCQPKGACQILSDFLQTDSQPAACNVAIGFQLRNHFHRHIRWNGER